MSSIGFPGSYSFPTFGSPAIANPYTSDPNYAGDPGTYGNPYGLSPQLSQQNYMMSIYMTMMQSQLQLQAGFSHYMGVAQSYPGTQYQPQLPGYQTQLPGYQPQPQPCQCGTQAPVTGYNPAPTYTPAPQPAPAPAPAPPAKKGGYA